METLRQISPCRIAGGISMICHAPPPPMVMPMTPHDPYTALKNMALLPIFEVPSPHWRVEGLLNGASENSEVIGPKWPTSWSTSHGEHLVFLRTPVLTWVAWQAWPYAPLTKDGHQYTDTGYPLPDFYLQNTCKFAVKSALVRLPTRCAKQSTRPLATTPAHALSILCDHGSGRFGECFAQPFPQLLQRFSRYTMTGGLAESRPLSSWRHSCPQWWEFTWLDGTQSPRQGREMKQNPW